MEIKVLLICLLLTFGCSSAFFFGKYDNPSDSEATSTSKPEDDSVLRSFFKRLASNLSSPNKKYQPCTTPDGSPGHCKHIRHCHIKDLGKDILKVFDHLCIIENMAVGVCCEDEVRLPSHIPVIGDQLNDRYDEVDPSGRIVNRPENRGCGLATKQFPKITGGRPADPEEWPWMAAVIRPGYPNAHCGGVLITDRHVLTAAHCTYKFTADKLYARLGEYDFKAFNDTRSRDFRVMEIRQHIDFDPSTYTNDIAILKLDRPTIFNTYIWPVCLPPLGETWDGWTGVVTGWGTQSYGGPYSNVLMEVSIPILSHENCQSSFIERINEKLLCAGHEDGGRDSCQGDSGGPLLVQIPNKHWVVVGIVSWGLRCGEPNHPGVYTRVNQYMTWIIENTVF